MIDLFLLKVKFLYLYYQKLIFSIDFIFNNCYNGLNKLIEEDFYEENSQYYGCACFNVRFCFCCSAGIDGCA